MSVNLQVIVTFTTLQEYFELLDTKDSGVSCQTWKDPIFEPDVPLDHSSQTEKKKKNRPEEEGTEETPVEVLCKPTGIDRTGVRWPWRFLSGWFIGEGCIDFRSLSYSRDGHSQRFVKEDGIFSKEGQNDFEFPRVEVFVRQFPRTKRTLRLLDRGKIPTKSSILSLGWSEFQPYFVITVVNVK